jgi:hypothetical protein
MLKLNYSKYCIIHLSKDKPDFNLDLKLEDLKQLIENHNEEVERLEREIPRIIQNKFRVSFQAPTGRKYPYHELHIKNTLKNRFENYYTNYTSDKIIDNINKYSTKETYNTISCNNGIIRFNGMIIAEDNNLTETDIQNYIEIMDKLVKDEFLSNNLKELKESKKNIDLQINEIKQEITPIVEAIDKEIYDTKAKCCPTFLRMIRNYFF